MSDIAAADTTSEITTHGTDKVLVTDAKGRVIAVRKLNALQIFRLSKAMGASAENSRVMDLATIASSVSRIDTLDFAFPSKERDVEFLFDKLDFHGLEAAGKGLGQLAEADAGAGVDAAKN